MVKKVYLSDIMSEEGPGTYIVNTCLVCNEYLSDDFADKYIDFVSSLPYGEKFLVMIM